MGLKTALEMTAEQTENAENAEENGVRCPAVPSAACTRWDETAAVSDVPSMLLLLRVFRVLRVFRGNSHRRF